MTREEAIKKANDKLCSIIYLSECAANPGLRKVYGNMAEWLARVTYLAEIGLKAQQEAENEPLKLDELREMEGEPVWCVSVDADVAAVAEWMLVGKEDCEGRRYIFDFLNYGEMWLAYRRKPEEMQK